MTVRSAGHEGVAALMGNSPVPAMMGGGRGVAVVESGECRQPEISAIAMTACSLRQCWPPQRGWCTAARRASPLIGAPGQAAVATVITRLQLLQACSGLQSIGIWGSGTAAALTALIAGLNGFEAHVFHHRSERLSWLAGRGGLWARRDTA